MGVVVPAGLDTIFYSPFNVAYSGATINVEITMSLNNMSGVNAAITYYVCLWTGYYQDSTGIYGGNNAISAGFLQYVPGQGSQIIRAIATGLAAGSYYLSLYVYNNKPSIEHQGTFATIEGWYA